MQLRNFSFPIPPHPDTPSKLLRVSATVQKFRGLLGPFTFLSLVHLLLPLSVIIILTTYLTLPQLIPSPSHHIARFVVQHIIHSQTIDWTVFGFFIILDYVLLCYYRGINSFVLFSGIDSASLINSSFTPRLAGYLHAPSAPSSTKESQPT